MQIISDKINFSELKERYVNAEPFPHIVIDNFLDEKFCEKLANNFPDHNADFWLKYNNPIEKKLLYNHLDNNMPPVIKDTLLYLNGDHTLKCIAELTGIENLVSDPDLHGGGMHCSKRGGKLDIHIDYSIHPKMNLERRINLILYLNKDWKEEYGGNLELWDKDVQNCIVKVRPVFNRAVIFNTGDISYHGHPDPISCPDNISRKSLALYYLTTPRKDATHRFKARFVARPQDSKDPEIEAFRIKRSGLDTAKDLYETNK